jgi:mono/diheme cytochrome c family protein
VRKVLATLAGLVLVIVAGGLGMIYSGVYNISAIEQHTAPVYWVLTKTARRSIAVRSDDIEVPDLSDPALIETGLLRYQDHCVQCHGAPGIAPQRFAMAMTPVPPSLLPSGREWSSEEIFWTIKHGVKMSGMPGWKFQLPKEDMWAVTAFVQTLPQLTPAAYRDLLLEAQDASIGHDVGAVPEFVGRLGDKERGRAALTQYGCTSCHRIQGMVGPDVRVGPPLRNVAEQEYVAGILPNTPEALVDWIRGPQEIDPLSAMPDMGVTERDAWDMAAYLYDPD